MSGSLTLVVIAALAGLGAYYRSTLERHVIRRRLGRIERVAIAAHPECVEAKVVGSVVAVETITAPISGRACVHYHVKVDLAETVADSGHWSEILDHTGGVPFMLEDGDARALIDPDGARIALRIPIVGRMGEAGERGAAFLAAQRMIVVGKVLRFHEWIIEPGARLAVAGMGVRVRDPRRSGGGRAYRDATETILQMSSTREHRLLISDEPDGR